MSFTARSWARVNAMLRLAPVSSTTDAAATVTLAGEPDDLPRFQPYGFFSRPKPGAEAVVMAAGSSGDEAVIILIGDRRVSIALDDGEVAIADDLGQYVRLTRSQGVIVNASLIKLGADATLGAARAGHGVDRTAVFKSWMDAVSVAAGVPTYAFESIGQIAEGSSVVRIEG